MAAGFFASSSELESEKKECSLLALSATEKVSKNNVVVIMQRAVPELSELDESFLALALGVAVLTGAAGRHEINSFAPRKKKQQLYLMYKINDYMLV